MPGGHLKFADPAGAYWNNKSVLAEYRGLILDLNRAVGHATDLHPYQWAQLMSFALEFSPDMILELGRGKGNSTCVFTEAANLLGPNSCRVLSLCLSNDWEVETSSKIKKIVADSWFKPLTALKTNIITFDYETALKNYKRVLVFWDAHGFEVAECVLGRILPLIAERPHLVIMHDLSDARYLDPASKNYGDKGLWKRNHWPEGARMRLGHIDSAVEQAISIVDFSSRNNISIESADHSYHSFFSANPDKADEMARLLGEFFSLNAHWFWFTLNDRSGAYTFPKFIKPVEIRRTFSQRLRKAVSILFGWERF